MYQLFMKQLREDGYGNLASELSQTTQIEEEATVGGGKCLLEIIEDGSSIMKRPKLGHAVANLDDFDIMADDADMSMPMEIPISKTFPNYSMQFLATHKHACTVAKFSQDGQFVATGSADCSIKLIEVKKIHYFSLIKGESSEDYTGARPVIRNFYDHHSIINDLDFHPIEPFLVSGSKDCTIKFFDHVKPNQKRAYRHIIDTHPVRSVNFHPSGDFLLAGTEHPMIRLYDVNTFQAYICPEVKHHHLGPITQVRYAPQGNVYASASKDGSIKLWDVVSNRCVNTIKNAHNGEIVSSVQFSPSGKYLLSSGANCTL